MDLLILLVVLLFPCGCVPGVRISREKGRRTLTNKLGAWQVS